MYHSFLHRLVALAGVAGVGLVPFACSVGGDATAPVGTPCTANDEQNFRFRGYKVTEETIEVGSPQCGGGGVCLMNHFQGRVSCPLGQPAPKDAQGLDGCVPVFKNGEYEASQGSCAPGSICAQAGSLSPACDPAQGADADQLCLSRGAGSKCGSDGFCECNTNADCAFATDAVVSCDVTTRHCVSYACHVPGDCQQAGATSAENAGKACCLPGTDTPVTTSVCGQCKGQGADATRDAENAVYCTCRCGVAEGEPDEPDFDFCTCPDDFECSEIRKNVGLGDQELSGKYCIRRDTAYDANQDQCGLVDGYWAPGGGDGLTCAGVGTGKCQAKDGVCAD